MCKESGIDSPLFGGVVGSAVIIAVGEWAFGVGVMALGEIAGNLIRDVRWLVIAH